MPSESLSAHTFSTTHVRLLLQLLTAPLRPDLFLVVVGHLQPSPLEAALDVEALVGLAAVEDGLVAADFLGDEVERLDEAEPQLLALLVLGDGDVLDVTDQPEVVDANADGGFLSALWGKPGKLRRSTSDIREAASGKEGGDLRGPRGEGRGWRAQYNNVQLSFCDQRAGADDAPGVLYDQDVVAAVLLPDPLEALCELLGADVADGGEHAQAVEEAGLVVRLAQGADLVAGGQRGGDVGRDEVVAKEAGLLGCGGCRRRRRCRWWWWWCRC